MPRAVVPILLEPLIASFSQAYPEIEVEIAASGELVDLATEGFDAGIRLGQFIAPDMVTVRLTQPFPAKNRLPNPSKIRPLDFKSEFRRSAICAVSATIGIDWSTLGIFRESGVTRMAQKKTVSVGKPVRRC